MQLPTFHFELGFSNLNSFLCLFPCKFIPNKSNAGLFQTNVRFPWRFKKSGFNFIIKHGLVGCDKNTKPGRTTYLVNGQSALEHPGRIFS